MYKLIRQLLFCLPAEFSHTITLRLLKLLHIIGLSGFLRARHCDLPVTVMGLEFPNPVGLAAGLDKNGDYIDALGALGFGFIEIGTVTPRPQPGNDKPRLFRLPRYQAIINRMGFNNKGVDYLLEQLDKCSYRGIIGINIGKNFSTPVEHALDDYLICLRKVYVKADYIVVNLSSPNTPGLRNLQFGDQLDELLLALKTERQALIQETGKKVPVLVKIAPDLDEAEINTIAGAFLRNSVDGAIATNTTIDREAVQNSAVAKEAGGLSGKPLSEKSTAVISQLSLQLGDDIPVIGVGGILNGHDAAEKALAGASLLQIYSGFIYRGPALISEAVMALSELYGSRDREKT